MIDAKSIIFDLSSWVKRNKDMVFSTTLAISFEDSQHIKTSLIDLAYHFQRSKPIYKPELVRISNNLFYNNGSYIIINQILFG